MNISPISRDEQPLVGYEHMLLLSTEELETLKRALILRAMLKDSRALRYGYKGVHTKALDILEPLDEYLHDYKGDN